MHRFTLFCFAAILVVAPSIGLAQSGVKIFKPDQMHFVTAPGAKGVQTATLAGDPNGTRFFVLRVKMSPSAQNRPHTHKTTEILTIVSGTLDIGFGTTVNRNDMQALSPGTVVVIPAGVPHYSMPGGGGTVQYDVSGMGPSTNIPIKKH